MSKMDKFWLIFPVAMFILQIGMLVYMTESMEKRSIRYDCRLAEISPDFSVEVKNACRKKMHGRI